jgi:hypothetical protein
VFDVVVQPLAAGTLGFLAAAMLLRFTHASP